MDEIIFTTQAAKEEQMIQKLHAVSMYYLNIPLVNISDIIVLVIEQVP